MLNGKRYDALTGKLVDADDAKSSTTPAKIKPVHAAGGKVLDGFSKKPARTHGPAKVAHAVHSTPEHSKTLMRKTVKKPAVHTAAAPAAAGHAAAQPKTVIINHANPARELRANHFRKSAHISKFGKAVQSTTTVGAILPVKPAPGEVATAANSAIASTSQSLAALNPFDLALERASSHELPKHKKSTVRRRLAKKLHISTRTLNTGMGLAAVLIRGGFIAYQNVPNLAVRLAATRAGVHASLPGYQPAGFALAGPIQYQPGEITLSYKSNNHDNREFQVKQKASAWNSETLLDSFINANKLAYQTYQDKGKTIYIYDGNNATWIDGGVWYQVNGSAALNSDQLLRIAGSL
jgi:hypothetical protein